MTYNSKRKTINLVDPYWKVWSWDGAKWKRTQSKAPDRMLDFESDNLIYDPSRDCLFVYSTNNVIGLWKYKNKKWTRNSSKNSKYPSFTNLTYNSNLKKIATLGQSNGYWDEYDDSPVSCDALLLFDGKQWERKK